MFSCYASEDSAPVYASWRPANYGKAAAAPPPSPKADRSNSGSAAAGAEEAESWARRAAVGSGAGAACYWPNKARRVFWSIAGAAGAAAIAERESSDKELSAAGSAGLGAGATAGIKGEALRSITLFKVFNAFSMIGSTYWRIPKRLSKSYIAGIILVRDCILENTFTKG